MKKLFFVFAAVMYLSISALAQPYTLWTQTFGGSNGDYGRSVQQTDDGGYIIAGYTYSYGAGSCDFYLIKTNTSGNEQWSQTYGGRDGDVGRSVQQTSDGGYIILGYTYSPVTQSYDVYMIKTYENGNELWWQTFGGSSDDRGYSVQQTDDGGYIIAGITESYGAGVYDVYLIKTDAEGNEEWWQTFGGSNADRGYSVQQTSDGGYIIAGYTWSYGAGADDVYLIKTDANGNEQWSQTFGGNSNDLGQSVQQTSDGGYIIVGYTLSPSTGYYDVYLIKTDANGNESWSQTFGGSSDDRGNSVQQTSDGGYIIAGRTSSYGAGSGDVYLIKTDTSGNEQWYQTFGGSEDDWGYSVQQTDDGGYIIAGYTESYGAGGKDIYLIRVDSETPINTLSGALGEILTAGYYHVVGDIWVEDPDSLFIEAGVTLLFDGDYSFEIHGNLYANGTEDDSIKFIPISGVESWQGISFFASTLYDDDELQYCYITGANSSGISCNNSSLTIINCTINGNSADGYGGGIFCNNSSPTIEECIISENSANGDLANGGGVSCNDGSNPAIVYCVIDGNSAGGYGGGIHCGDSSSPTIENCTISGNHADDGGGISTYSSSPTILNTIVEGHMESDGIYFYDSPNASVTYCDFHNNEYGNFSGFVPAGLGTITSTNYNGDPCDEFYNIFENPLFVGGGDFRLLMGSPCVDAGDPNSPPDPDGTIVDIGAFYLYYPPIRFVLTPLNPPIVIPETGGSFEFNVMGENMTYLTLTTDFWTLVLLPEVGGLEIMNVSDIVIAPGEVISVDREQEVPAFAPAGTYTYYGYIGDYPWVVDCYDSFIFEKEGTDGGYLGTANDWLCSGEPFLQEAPSSIHPSSLILHPSTPNPFNAETVISFELRAASFVELVVYDIQGREVARLVDGFQPAGSYERKFRPLGLSSGVYFARLKAGGFSRTQKLLLIK